MDDAPQWDRPVFRAGARTVSIRDVLQAAAFRGDLTDPWAEVCRRAQAEEGEADADAVQAASEQFRVDRDLITAEETEQWLEKRGLDLDEFADYFVRTCSALAPAGDQTEPDAPAYERASEEMRDLLRIDLLMSGRFDRLAERLAWRYAAQAASEQPAEAADFTDEMRALESAYQAQINTLLTQHERRQALASLRLALTRVELDVLEFESHDAANEALLCLREDGESMEDVARDGHYPLRRRDVLFEEVDSELQPRLGSASPGEVLGPLPRGEGFEVCQILHKIEPTLEEEQVQARVDQFLVQRHFSELAAKHIRWIIAPSSTDAEAA